MGEWYGCTTALGVLRIVTEPPNPLTFGPRCESIKGQSNIPLANNMKLTNIEADFLTHCIDVWCNETPQIAGRPVMFTTQEGGDEKVLLTHDQIESLFLRIQALK